MAAGGTPARFAWLRQRASVTWSELASAVKALSSDRRVIVLWLILFAYEGFHALSTEDPVDRFLGRHVYNFCTQFFRKPRPHSITLVEIDPQYEPPEAVGSDLAKGREYLAALLDRVAQARPASIVVDARFPSDSPDGGLPGMVSKIRSEQIPVLIGCNDRSAAQAKAEIPPGLARSLEDNSGVVLLRTWFDDGCGLLTFAEDIRRVPIKWPTKTSNSLAGDGFRWRETLSAAAAQEHDRDYLTEGTLSDLTGRQPFVSFIKESRFHTLRALDVLCGERRSDYRTCDNQPVSAIRRQTVDDALRSRIVLVGYIDSNDQYRTVAGSMPGFLVHANYIEALLDDRVIYAASLWWTLLASLVWFLLIEFVFHAIDLWSAILISTFLSVAFTVGVLAFAVLITGYYVDLLFPSFFLIVIRSLMIRSKEKEGTT